MPFAAILISLFTHPNQEKWGWIYGTFDNPPQGDRGYINRVVWMIRNPLYGYNKAVSVKYDGGYVSIKGNPNISDKYKISGWMDVSYL